ncbi:unnamed protein product [Caenorhabditis auriculariae]|uniref:Transmembrane protein n=1 Tax=Caenorhabditis auriculariae TaxID=2777116 RepID=A0A8S1H312_9PELO|nr:unnamed protein product [Caenorhabditis auriculariae]
MTTESSKTTELHLHVPTWVLIVMYSLCALYCVVYVLACITSMMRQRRDMREERLEMSKEQAQERVGGGADVIVVAPPTETSSSSVATPTTFMSPHCSSVPQLSGVYIAILLARKVKPLEVPGDVQTRGIVKSTDRHPTSKKKRL